MNLDIRIEQMARNARSIQQLAQVFSAEQARWKPDADTWSVVEVMNHVYDEERTDFRARLVQAWQLTVDFSSDAPDETDDLAVALQGFLREREQSLAWLRQLQAPDWEVICPVWSGEIRAGDMLASWVAHDLLHLRQLVELHYAHTQRAVQPYEVDYAGEW